MAFEYVLLDDASDKALLAQMLILPSEIYLAESMDVVDVDAIHVARNFVKQTLAQKLKESFLHAYCQLCSDKPYQYQILDVAARSLKNVALDYLTMLNTDEVRAICMKQFNSANNMTDYEAALLAMIFRNQLKKSSK